ncbi:hypothetical protein ES703_25696 [subsurface metagenome]
MKFIDRTGEATALDVARGLNITQINASRLLGHYFRQGLLERHTINKFGEKCYEITDRGRERLRWIFGRGSR